MRGTSKLLTLTLLLAFAHAVFAQGKPIPLEELAKNEKAAAAMDRGRAFLAKDQLDEAIAAFREAVEIEKTYNYHASSGNYALGKALALAGRTDEALAAYRQTLRWYPVTNEIVANGPPFPMVHMDYAILLAKAGRLEDAKAVYYSALRLLTGTDASTEPIPFLVVFDPDPTMTVWELTPEKLIAAATMLKCYLSDNVPLVKEVRKMEPNWLIPSAYLAWRSKNADLFKEAGALAKTKEEKEWLRACQAGEPLFKIAQARRKASELLYLAKLDLKQNYEKVAIVYPSK